MRMAKPVVALALRLALMVLHTAKAGSLSKTVAFLVVTGILQVVLLLLVLAATAVVEVRLVMVCLLPIFTTTF